MKRNSRWMMIALIGTFLRNNLFTIIGFGIIAGRDNLSLFLAGIAVLTLLILPLYCFTKWYYRKFGINDGNFHYHYGIFVKKHQSVPIEKIANIELEQNFFHQLIKRTRVKIDTGNQNEGESELLFLLKLEDAQSFKQMLLESGDVPNEEKQGWDYRLDKKQVLVYGLTRNSVFPLVSLAFSAFYFLQEVGEWFNYKIELSTWDIFVYMIKNDLAILVLMVSGIYILSKVVMSLYTYIQYYDFSIRKEEEKMIVQYGYLTKKRKEIPLDRLYGIVIKQSPFFQLFGYYQIEGCLVGQDQSDEKTLLFLMGKKKMTKDFIGSMIPQFQFEGDILRTKRRHMTMFFVFPISVFSISVILLSLLSHWYMLLLLLLVPVILLYGFLQYRNGGIGRETHLIYGASGGFYKRMYIATKKSIQSYTKSQSYFQRRKDVQTISLALWNQQFTVKHLEEKLEVFE